MLRHLFDIVTALSTDKECSINQSKLKCFKALEIGASHLNLNELVYLRRR